MRVVSPLLKWVLLVGAMASGAALANCSAAEDASDEEVFSGEDDITGANNKMGLKLVYDETTHHVRAQVRRKLRAGETLRLRVRRGRLTIDSQAELDCSQLPEAPALPLAEGVTKVTYDGPEVDASLLASVYDEQWVLGNVTPQMIDRLAREGADSIVEACIVKDATVRARLQTSIQYAWDQADPLANAAVMNRQSIHVLGLDAGAGVGSGSPLRSMEKYAELCVHDLGEIPFFKKQADGKYSTFDCRDFVETGGAAIEGVEGALIPQSVSNADGTDATPAACDDRNLGRYNCYSKCDKPEWLHQSCEPGPTVATAKNEQGTHWTLLCRAAGENAGKDTTESLTKTKRFNDISMIGHNPKTGKTCFFQNKIFDGTDGARIPHPADVEKSRHVWDEPKGNCTSCHSADAFIHSPWIDGAKRRDGNPIVPMMGKHPDFAMSSTAAPYSVVNGAAQARGRVGGSSWELPKQLVSAGAGACTSCHRIGGGEGMRLFPRWALGEEGMGDPLASRLTDASKKLAHTHWMFEANDWTDAKYASAVAHIESCAANPKGEGCAWADVPATR